jgi:hypothetical protein
MAQRYIDLAWVVVAMLAILRTIAARASWFVGQLERLVTVLDQLLGRLEALGCRVGDLLRRRAFYWAIVVPVALCLLVSMYLWIVEAGLPPASLPS